eukprot:1205130-Alexandrium_andersonii.AAC.1
MAGQSPTHTHTLTDSSVLASARPLSQPGWASKPKQPQQLRDAMCPRIALGWASDGPYLRPI